MTIDRSRSRRALAALVAASGLLAACGSSSGAVDGPAAGAADAPRGLVATLENDVRELPRERIAWSTYWKLCWDRHATAMSYVIAAVS